MTSLLGKIIANYNFHSGNTTSLIEIDVNDKKYQSEVEVFLPLTRKEKFTSEFYLIIEVCVT